MLATATCLALSNAVAAHGLRSAVSWAQVQIDVKIEASKPETVTALAGILEIRSDLKLGLLAKQAGRPAPHITDARTILWPEYKTVLMAAGMVDLDPLLMQLDSASGQEAVTAAYNEVEGALMKGRSALNPTSADVLLSLEVVAKEVATAYVNQSGPTEVQSYQAAWSMIMAARGELDLLMRDPDPSIVKYATEAAMAFDEVIISIPDPDQSAPVQVDPALFNDLVSRLEKIDQEA